MDFETSLSFAKQLDNNDPLKDFRNRFIIPEANGKQLIYFLGNSLGLQPKATSDYLQRIMNDWALLGVESFFHATEPWMDYHDKLTNTLAVVTGALPQEVVVMNQLTVNLHLMLVSFYRPAGKRYKIICEAKAFPSDQYAFETHVKHHGYSMEDAVVEVHPRPGEHTLRAEDILEVIQKYADETALVLFGGINYYTGQLFDIGRIAKAAHDAGAVAGFDLAHATGNVELQLHKWDVDFACWCSYKYLNSGPGAVGGAFIHEKHHDKNLGRFAGWWGYDKPTRFNMEKGFKPMPGAEGWQLSTPSLFLYAAHRAALEIITEAGWQAIQSKRKQQNKYLWYLLNEIEHQAEKKTIEIITPVDEQERGSQVSMLMPGKGKTVYNGLMTQGIMVDWREPNVIRLAPVPLYNTYEEIWKFATVLKELVN